MQPRSFIVVGLLVIVAIVESSCGGGTQTSPPPSSQSAIPTPTVLRTIYRVLNGTDRMSTVGANERTTYPLEAQVYYVPDQAANGRTTLKYLAKWKFYCWGDGPLESASDNTAWSAVCGDGTFLFAAGESIYHVYLITDSIQNVTARMDDLLQMGVK